MAIDGKVKRVDSRLLLPHDKEFACVSKQAISHTVCTPGIHAGAIVVPLLFAAALVINALL